MKVLHSAAMMTPSRGQLAQMDWEQSAADRVGLRWHSRFFCPRDAAPKSSVICYSDAVAAADRIGSARKFIAWFRFRKSYYQWLTSVQSNYDVLLLRYNFHDPYQWSFLRHATRPVYLVHHTLEVPEMFSARTVSGSVRGVAEWLLGPPTLRRATGAIGVTDEIAEYEFRRADCGTLRVGTFPNGVEYADGPVADARAGIPALLYVAGTFAVWHGLDLLVDALRASDEEFVVHLVGHLTDDDRRRVDADSRFVIHGSMPRAAIRDIAAGCDLGLSTFALERKHMRQACTLKVRDYLTMGLPVYAGYQDVFPPEFPYFVQGPVDAPAILRCARSLRKTPRHVVAEAARPFIDKGILLQRAVQFLEGSDVA